MPEPSILDARLAEIDRRLRTIQSGLAPAAQAAGAAEAPLVPPEAAPVPKRLSDVSAPSTESTTQPRRGPMSDMAQNAAAGELVGQLRALLDSHERLLASARELAKAQQPAPAAPSVSVSAGPFADTEALRRFERSLAALPEVRQVIVREYEGEDRAIVDVHLVDSTS